MARDPRGRRSKLTPELAARVIELVRIGNYVNVACAACGISERTYYNWQKQGEDLLEAIGDAEFDPRDIDDGEVMPEAWSQASDHERAALLFVQATRVAEAEAESYAVGIVRKHMPDQWTAAMTYLERRNPKRWRRRDLHEIQTAGALDEAEMERAILENPEAVRLLHRALQAVAGVDVPLLEEHTD